MTQASGVPIPRAVSLVLLALCACATVSPVLPREDLPPANSQGLQSAAESFYSGRTGAELRQAVASARLAGPGRAIHQELEAELAWLDGRESDRFEFLFEALRDPADDATLFHLHQLMDAPRSYPQRARLVRLLEGLSEAHADPEIRATAAYHLAFLRQGQGQTALRDAAASQVHGRLSLATLGSWDNDQGKGYDLPQGPEERLDFSRRYEGALLEIGWRLDAPTTYRGELELSEQLAPSRWALGYAAGALRTDADGDYELRLGTSGPVKVWVDGKAVLTADQVDGYLFDQFVVPLRLPAGTHRVLIKTAHREKDWRLMARITGKGGGPAALDLLRPEVACPSDGSPVAGVPAVEEDLLVDARVARVPPGARRLRLALGWSGMALGGAQSVHSAEDYLGKAPESLFARQLLVQALWNNGERGRTADLLDALDREAVELFPLLRLQLARFRAQELRRQKAREQLLALSRAHPQVVGAYRELGRLFEAEGWTEDRCRVWTELDRLAPQQPATVLELAECLEAQDFERRAAELYDTVLRQVPRNEVALRKRQQLALGWGDFQQAISLARRGVEARPTAVSPYLLLAETLRRAGQPEQAREILAQALALKPDSPEVLNAQAGLAYQQGQKEPALELWQAALARNPEDEKLANWLEYLSPSATGPLAADIPDEGSLAVAVTERARLQATPGANVAYLFDQEVTQLKPDGSTVNVVSVVMHALNQAGRDRLTRQTLGGEGRPRILHAYAVDPDGHRTEASAVRGRTVYFRGLAVGSSTVLQYRMDTPPVGYLARHLARTWWFQGTTDQRQLSRWILWAPAGTKLHEQRVGDLAREERVVGEQVRIAWSVREIGPLPGEPQMPPATELLANVKVSTVPDWDTFLKWEEALLNDAFRNSPEVDALSRRLFEGVTDPAEKVARLHTFLMEEIRYEQDYENHIAGVKPHPASMVLERRYGDCKDKAVLFISLARKAGLEAHFALVRTRDAGPVVEAVPMQQFNHAIAYVPAQPGLPEGRFYDPTADALDVDSLRYDDPGTRSVVYDPQARRHTWVDIPFQSTEANRRHTRLQLRLGPDGRASGQVSISAVGRTGAMLRQAFRNAEQTRQLSQYAVAQFFPGATATEHQVLEAKSLRTPAQFQVSFVAPTAARQDGDELRMRVPVEWSPKGQFALAERRHPLVLGAPEQLSWKVELEIPLGAKIKKLPGSGSVDSPCLTFQRTVTATDRKVTVEQTARYLCPRISPAEYGKYRGVAEGIGRIADDELVVLPDPSVPVIRPAGGIALPGARPPRG